VWGGGGLWWVGGIVVVFVGGGLGWVAGVFGFCVFFGLWFGVELGCVREFAVLWGVWDEGGVGGGLLGCCGAGVGVWWCVVCVGGAFCGVVGL